MAESLGRVTVEVRAETASAESGIKRVRRAQTAWAASTKRLGPATRSATRELTRFKNAAVRTSAVTRTLRGSFLRLAAVLGAGFGLIRLAKFIVNTNREFERLDAQLRTVQGSAEAAAQTFKTIEQLAIQTPFQIEGLTRAFVNLRVFGVVPTVEGFLALGDMASAFGTTIEELAIVIRSAAAGQTESIRRFVQNFEVMENQVAVTFGGVRKVIDRSAQAITDALVEISENNFAGAMAREMETLNGILSNIQDNFGILARTIGIALLPILRGAAQEVLFFTETVNQNQNEVIKWTVVVIEGVRLVADAFTFMGIVAFNQMKGIVQALAHLGHAFLALIQGNFRRAGEAIVLMGEFAAAGVTSFIEQLGQLGERFAAFIDALETKAADGGKKIGTALVFPMVESFETLKKEMEAVGNSVIKSLVDGMLSGFKDQSLGQTLWRAAKSFLSTFLVFKITNFLQIASPSKLSRGWGQSVVEGFAMGLQDGPRLSLPDVLMGKVPGLPTVSTVSAGGGAMSAGPDFSKFPPASNPLAMARDRDWQNFLSASNRTLAANGAR